MDLNFIMANYDLKDIFTLYFQLKERSEFDSEDSQLFQQLETRLTPILKIINNENGSENLTWWAVPKWEDFVKDKVENMSDEDKRDLIKDVTKKYEEEYPKVKNQTLEDRFLSDAYKFIRFHDKNLYRETIIEIRIKSNPLNASDKLLPEIEIEVNKKAELNLKGVDKGLGYCYSFWKEKKRILKTEYGIDWLSPADRNPGILYD